MTEDRIITTAPGVQLSVRVAGSGPLVILMHGWPELGLSWRHQIAPLAAAGYTVAAPDMRGYGASSAPDDPAAYDLDSLVDDMAAVADALGHERWVSVGHDWGSPVAWRSALRYPERVVGVFSLSVPHAAAGASPVDPLEGLEVAYADRFFYALYFQAVGPAEAELDADPRDALKRIFYSLSGDAPFADWITPRPRDSRLLDGLAVPPAGPLSFMTDAELDAYAAAYARRGFHGSINWYRAMVTNREQERAYGDYHIRQPTAFLSGDKEIVLAMVPGALENQRQLCEDLRMEAILPGAGHWIQQERVEEVNAALLTFLREHCRF